MQQSSERTYFHSSIAHQSSDRIVGCNSDHVECKILKEDNEGGREGKLETASTLGKESHEMHKDPLTTERSDEDRLGNMQRLHNYTEEEISVGQAENEFDDMLTSHSICHNNRELLENETIYFTDKAVTQSELPEPIVCCKDSSLNIMKDICIDKGVPFWDKFSIEKCQAYHNRVVDILYSDLVGRIDLTTEGVGSALPSSEDVQFLDSSDRELGKYSRPENFLEECLGDVNATGGIVNDIYSKKFVPENLPYADNTVPILNSSISFNIDELLFSDDKDKKKTTKCNPSMSVEGGESTADGTDNIVNDTFDECVISGKPLLQQEQDLEGQHHYASEFAQIDQQQPVQGHVPNVNCVNLRPLGVCQGTKSVTSVASSSSDTSFAIDSTKDLPFDRMVESGSITFDFNSSSSSMSARLEGAQNADNEHSAQNFSMSVLEDGGLDSLTGSTRSFFIQHGHGESDFLGSASSHMPYSGSIPFSGNISLRSDSSTASTRSFAFPVLHSEWNSSPVKMAKAGRKQLKRRRCWRIPICCCKF